MSKRRLSTKAIKQLEKWALTPINNEPSETLNSCKYYIFEYYPDPHYHLRQSTQVTSYIPNLTPINWRESK